jgi:hypothetical protein
MFDRPDDFQLKQEFFHHPSELHGIYHTYRVMCHVLVIGSELNLVKEKRLAFCAAFIHDMSRNHDGFSLGHGPRAAKEKVRLFMPMFLRNGMGEEDQETIQAAVANHSQYTEFKNNSPFFLVAALLKDADALDRIRMGENNLNTKYLRLEVSKGLIDFAAKLYFASLKKTDITFLEMHGLAEEIYQKPVNY